MPANTTAAPAARFDNLVTTETEGDVLVFDQMSNHIHHLNETSAAVWRLCDGTRSVTGIALESGLTDDMVKVALAKLADANLLVSELGSDLRGTGQSRRAFMKKAAVAGSVPVIVSVTAPLAASATSPQPYTTNCNGARNCNQAVNCCQTGYSQSACSSGAGSVVVTCTPD